MATQLQIKIKSWSAGYALKEFRSAVWLVNGTRLIITIMGKFVLEGKVISESNVGDKLFIPRLSLSPLDIGIPFKFQRRKFLLAVSFAITINKSQRQTLAHVGVYLPTPVFSHGQLYVVVSRVMSIERLKILITDEDDEDTNDTSNIVYEEVFRNV